MIKMTKLSNLPLLKRATLPVLIILVLSFVACKTLDLNDPNDPSPADASVQALVTGLEAGMRNQLQNFLPALAVIGREAYNFDGADPAWVEELLIAPKNDGLDEGGFLVQNPWRERYRTIQTAVILMDKAQNDVLLSAAEVSGVTGYAKTIIAYQLLLMLNAFDENGIKLDFTGVLDNFATKEESFAEIVRYLDEGNTDLGNAGSSFAFTLSGGLAGFETPAEFAQLNRALRARVAVYMGQFQTALDALQDSFINPTGDLNTGAYHVFAAGLGDLLNPFFEVPTASFVKFRAHPSFKADAEAGDARFSSKVLDRSADATFNSPFGESLLSSGLAITLWASATSPVSIIRNEELILLRAEANVGLGNFAAAEADMNIVRAAAGLPAYTGTSAGNGLDRLLHEKRYSLFGEGHRWVDMRRYGRLDQLPLDRVGAADRPDDVVHEMYPRPNSEVSSGG